MTITMLRAVVLSLLFILPGIASAKDMFVANDPGGYVDDRVAQIARLRSEKTRVVIKGSCASACTLYLGLENACVTPGAKLGFHAPYSEGGNGAMPMAKFENLQRLMAKHYPPDLANWFMDGPAWDMDGVTWLTSAQVQSLGVRSCT